MSAVPKNSFVSATLDDDSQETREWIDALSGVIQNEGPQRAHFLLEQLLEHGIPVIARRTGGRSGLLIRLFTESGDVLVRRVAAIAVGAMGSGDG